MKITTCRNCGVDHGIVAPNAYYVLVYPSYSLTYSKGVYNNSITISKCLFDISHIRSREDSLHSVYRKGVYAFLHCSHPGPYLDVNPGSVGGLCRYALPG